MAPMLSLGYELQQCVDVRAHSRPPTRTLCLCLQILMSNLILVLACVYVRVDEILSFNQVSLLLIRILVYFLCMTWMQNTGSSLHCTCCSFLVPLLSRHSLYH